MMKITLMMVVTFLCCLSTSIVNAQADAISKYFNQYLEDDRFTVVYISPKMFQLFKKMDLQLDDDEADAVMDVVEDLRGLRILIAEENSNGLYQEATSKIDTKEYETLMTVRSKNEANVQFLIKDEGDLDYVNELLLLVDSDDSFVLMSFVGRMDLKKISKMAEEFD